MKHINNTRRALLTGAVASVCTLGAVATSSPASATIIKSGFTGVAQTFSSGTSQSDAECMGQWNSLITNGCNDGRGRNVHFDFETNNNNYFQAFVGGPGGSIKCWAESYAPDGSAFQAGSVITFDPTGNSGANSKSPLQLGAITIKGTHAVVCTMKFNSVVFSVEVS